MSSNNLSFVAPGRFHEFPSSGGFSEPGPLNYSHPNAPLGSTQIPRTLSSAPQNAAARAHSSVESAQPFNTHTRLTASEFDRRKRATNSHRSSLDAASRRHRAGERPKETRHATPTRRRPQWNEDTTVPGTFEEFGSASRRPAVQEVSPAARSSRQRKAKKPHSTQRARHPYARLLQLRRQGETARERRRRQRIESLNSSTVSAAHVSDTPPRRSAHMSKPPPHQSAHAATATHAAPRRSERAHVPAYKRTARPPRPEAQQSVQAPTLPPRVQRQGRHEQTWNQVGQTEPARNEPSARGFGITGGGDFMASLRLDEPVHIPPRMPETRETHHQHHTARSHQGHSLPATAASAVEVVLQPGARAHAVRSRHAHSSGTPQRQWQQQPQHASQFEHVEQQWMDLRTTHTGRAQGGAPSHPLHSQQKIISSARAGEISAPPGSAVDGSRVEQGDVHDMQGYLPPPAPFMYAPSQQDTHTSRQLYSELNSEPMWAQYSQEQPTVAGSRAAVFTAHVPDLADHVWHHSMKQAAAQAAADPVHTTYSSLGLAAAGGMNAQQELAPHEALDAAGAQVQQLQAGDVRGTADTVLGERPTGTWSHSDKQRLAADEGRLAFFSSAERLAEAVRQSGDLRTMLASLQGAMEAEGGVAADLAQRQAARAAAEEAGLAGLQRHDAHAALQRAAREQPWEGGAAEPTAGSADGGSGNVQNDAEAQVAQHDHALLSGGESNTAAAAAVPKGARGVWKVNAGGALQGHLLLCAAQLAHKQGLKGATSAISAAPHVLRGDALGPDRTAALRAHSQAVARHRRIKHAALNATWGKNLSSGASQAVSSLGDLVLTQAVTDRLWPAFLHATARHLDEDVEQEVQQVLKSV